MKAVAIPGCYPHRVVQYLRKYFFTNGIFRGISWLE